MFNQLPRGTETTPVVNGNDLQFDIQHQSREVPETQKDFLDRLGWTSAGYHPDTMEELFRKQPPADCSEGKRRAWDNELMTGYWYWYEAVAYEFTKFMTIGDD